MEKKASEDPEAPLPVARRSRHGQDHGLVGTLGQPRLITPRISNPANHTPRDQEGHVREIEIALSARTARGQGSGSPPAMHLLVARERASEARTPA